MPDELPHMHVLHVPCSMLNSSSLEKEITLEECNHTVHMSLPVGVVRGAGSRKPAMYYYSCMHVVMYAALEFTCRHVPMKAPLVISNGLEPSLCRQMQLSQRVFHSKRFCFLRSSSCWHGRRADRIDRIHTSHSAITSP